MIDGNFNPVDELFVGSGGSPAFIERRYPSGAAAFLEQNQADFGSGSNPIGVLLNLEPGSGSLLILVGERESKPVEGEFSAEELIDRVQEQYGLKIVQLASILGVSRTAVYNWKKGEVPSSDHVQRLVELASQASDYPSPDRLRVLGKFFKRRLTSGLTLEESLREGEPLGPLCDELGASMDALIASQGKIAERFATKPRLSAEERSARLYSNYYG